MLSNGRSVAKISRQLGINLQIFYNWKMKPSVIDGDQHKRFKELEGENQKLKTMRADSFPDIKILKDVLLIKWRSLAIVIIMKLNLIKSTRYVLPNRYHWIIVFIIDLWAP
jgi:hypothetical protein